MSGAASRCHRLVRSRRMRRVLAMAGLLAVPVEGGVAGQPDPWIGKTPALSVRRLAVESGRVTLEYPAKGWKVLPAGGQTIATLAESDGRALVQLERVRLNQGSLETRDFPIEPLPVAQ